MIEAGSNLKAASDSASKLETLRRQINDEDYLNAAIKRLALVLSNELMDIKTASIKARVFRRSIMR